MSNNLSASILLAASALVWTPLAFSADAKPAAGAHDHNHSQAATTATQKNGPQRNADMDAQIAHMRALHERLSRANTPEERQALMAEQAKVMQESMTMMHSMMPMQGHGDMQGKMSMGLREKAERMRMCHNMMGQRMEMMQEMMQTMMDRQGMSGGMMDGQGMGSGMMKQ
ncbi:MAG: hypothetical protein ACRD63_17905 [Pyrinomonadaceae bacterium]